MRLIKQVSYGKGALLNAIILKARQRVLGHYGLNGTVEEIKINVNWLLEKSHFLYGDLDLKVRVVLKVTQTNASGLE